MAPKAPLSGPKFVALFGPVLKAVRELGGSARPQEVYERVADELGLNERDKAEQTPSGVPRHENQIAWARFYLVRAGLLDSSLRGVWSLTAKGRDCPGLTHAQSLELFRQVRAEMPKPVRQPAGNSDGGGEVVAPDDAAPDPMPSGHRAQVIEVLQRLAPMGRADKGIILTTSGFTTEARREAVRDGVPQIELVDGEKLVSMLEELEIGLVPVAAYRVDEAFFQSFSKVLGETNGAAPA